MIETVLELRPRDRREGVRTRRAEDRSFGDHDLAFRCSRWSRGHLLVLGLGTIGVDSLALGGRCLGHIGQHESVVQWNVAAAASRIASGVTAR